MQPALDKTPRGCGIAAQRIFQRGQGAHHPNEGFASDEQDGSKMREPEPEIPHKTQPHPCADPDHRKAADNEQREQEMNDKYNIGQRHGYVNVFGKSKRINIFY